MIDDGQMWWVTEHTSGGSFAEWKEFLEARKLLTLLSKMDALVVLSMAKDGIRAESSTHSMIGLTRKQYYTRLMQLKKAGLIEKKENIYVQTTMGSFLQENCINSVMHAIRNYKKMAMVDVLRRGGNFSDEDLLRIKSTVCSTSNGNSLD